MKRKTLILGLAAALLLAIALAWAFMPQPVAVEVSPVTQGIFESTVDEEGKTRLTDRYVVAAALAGRLARISLREGDPVEAGMTIATLTPVLPALQDERTRRELRARVAGAEDNLARTAARMQRAEGALAQARTEQRRSEDLAQQGFIAQTKLDADRLATEAAQRESDTAAAEQRIAGHDLEQARAALDATLPGTAARPFEVRSPITGRVMRVLQQSETVVTLGAPLLELGDTARMEIVAELLTTDALAAHPGSRVRIEGWGGPVALEGRVRTIEPAAFTKISALGVEEQRVRVLIDFSSPRAQWQALGDGYRVGVRIVTVVQDDALQVPVSAVFPLPGAATSTTDAPKHGVFVIEGGRTRQVAVRLGGRNGTTAWIRSGLVAGQSVIVYPPASVRDGVRVRVRTP